MITVDTYIKKGAEFIDYVNYEGKIEDPNYIEGAIDLIVDGVELIDKSMWDYVDQLWAYIIDGLVAVNRKESFITYFPDQPIELELAPIKNDKVKISVRYDHTAYVVISKANFCEAIYYHASPFFEFLSTKAPSNKSAYDQILQQLNSIRNRNKGGID